MRRIGKYVAGWELLKSKLVAILARMIPCETFLERGILASMSQRLKSRTTVFRNFSKNRTEQPRRIGKYAAGWELLKSKLVAILARIK